MAWAPGARRRTADAASRADRLVFLDFPLHGGVAAIEPLDDLRELLDVLVERDRDFVAQLIRRRRPELVLHAFAAKRVLDLRTDPQLLVAQLSEPLTRP